MLVVLLKLICLERWLVAAKDSSTVANSTPTIMTNAWEHYKKLKSLLNAIYRKFWSYVILEKIQFTQL